MRFGTMATLVALAAWGGLAQAAPDPAKILEILGKNSCLACHAVDKKLVGPAYRDVAAKHKGDADAAAVLAKHIKEGSSGVWGPIPMPPNPSISDADIKLVVEWVLEGAPQ
jgi:cytochrome c